MDMPVHKKSIGALRCFRRSVEIEEYNGKLWIEYGSLAYQLQSHSSRQLKWVYCLDFFNIHVVLNNYGWFHDC